MKELQKTGFSVIVAALVLVAACFSVSDSPVSKFEAFEVQASSDVNPSQSSDNGDEPVVIVDDVPLPLANASILFLSSSIDFYPQTTRKHSRIRAPPVKS